MARPGRLELATSRQLGAPKWIRVSLVSCAPRNAVHAESSYLQLDVQLGSLHRVV